jgi:hypothetical protein
MKTKSAISLISLVCITSLAFSQTLTKPAVLKYDSAKACDGYILWMGQYKCQLIDRKGNTLFNLPGNLVAFFNNKEEIASSSFGNFVTYNKNLDVIWRFNTYIHHELTITPDNKVILLSEETHPINHISLRFDNILFFDSAGKELYKWSTFDHRRYLLSFMMKDKNIFRYNIRGSSDPDSVLFNMAPGLKLIGGNSTTREFFHMNAIQEIPENESEKRDSVFRKGNILLSFCNYNDSIASFIAIVDPVQFKVLWYYVQKDRKQMHTPAMLPNGHILVFVNNTGGKKDFSFIEEIDPVTKKMVWNYTEKFSKVQHCNAFGSCQRLPNGNTLISNCNGYIYEVTPDKKIVWQWYTNETMESNSFLYRAFLYPKEKLKWLVNDE